MNTLKLLLQVAVPRDSMAVEWGGAGLLAAPKCIKMQLRYNNTCVP
jgi:hypothetical protein